MYRSMTALHRSDSPKDVLLRPRKRNHRQVSEPSAIVPFSSPVSAGVAELTDVDRASIIKLCLLYRNADKSQSDKSHQEFPDNTAHLCANTRKCGFLLGFPGPDISGHPQSQREGQNKNQEIGGTLHRGHAPYAEEPDHQRENGEEEYALPGPINAVATGRPKPAQYMLTTMAKP